MKPCPFCGGKNLQTDILVDGMYTVVCHDCGCFYSNATAFCEADTIIKWDERASENNAERMTRTYILEEAKRCITGQRQQDYGKPEDNFGLIGRLWTVYLGELVTAQDVAMMMILLKAARIKNGGGTGDSYVDICGYAALAGEMKGDKDDK